MKIQFSGLNVIRCVLDSIDIRPVGSVGPNNIGPWADTKQQSVYYHKFYWDLYTACWRYYRRLSINESAPSRALRIGWALMELS